MKDADQDLGLLNESMKEERGHVLQTADIKGEKDPDPDPMKEEDITEMITGIEEETTQEKEIIIENIDLELLIKNNY